ncbi:thioredoxin domain-containing protein [Cellulomonas sp. ATA003]|uniref:DsbA family protein n=1 Tax=Cellulomonas sp. ATA003 TaxID=3073064 RepID=UPI002873AB43|nr:thioredoxin domain-containing protein [Cellulomonas sp. ATA003]WNB87105.1 thioredoxin domain-containing protein [Cellulomonas sp. ATA003]
MSTTHNRPPAARRREEARAAAARLREEQERAARRARTIAISVLVACLVLFGAVVAVILTSADDDVPTGAPLGEVTAPAGSTEAGAIPVGASGVAGTTEGSDPDAVVVSVYADYLCPFCGLFEETNADALDAMRASGEVVVEYHPVSILDRLSAGSEYSTRAATAAALVADRSPEAFVAFNHAMYAAQPAENSAGLTDAQIADVAAEAGADEAVVAAIADGSYLTGDDSFRPWVAAVTERAGQDLDQLATPAILIDGEQLDPQRYDWRQPGQLEAAIADARD